ncbi:MAG TPA: DNA-binding protein [Burkholderiales bacterium]|nr:DNA-binding protein [Burkholderiales bacterium]
MDMAIAEVEQDAPLFKTAKGALLFAFNYSHGTLKRSALAGMMGGARRAGRGLGGLDGAAQAGMIKAMVVELGDARAAIVVARFEPQSIPCSCRSACCRGFRENPAWSEAVAVLTERALVALSGHLSHFRMRRALVARFFGQRHNLNDIAKQCGVNRDTASAHYKKVVEWLAEQETIGRHALEAKLHEANIIE